MPETGYYLVELEVSPPGGMMPGAPNLTLKLGVNAVNGEINGQATLTQAIAPPNGEHVFPVAGSIHHTGFAGDIMLVSLSGQYVQSFPPPAIGSYLVPFSAALALAPDWNGTGSYSFGHQRMTGCKVTKTSQ